ncbi:MAG TPA: TIGR01777 family protein [Calditrichaeota bacterium]|nr:TIGR01777 family protein [Calditrichota bacterium]
MKEKSKTVLITGGSGHIGSRLTTVLLKSGYRVIWLSRRDASVNNVTVYKWDLARKQINLQAIEQTRIIIHLAGANIGAKRWSSKRKQEIVNSRVKSAELLLQSVQKSGQRLEAFISASAVGYYGAQTRGEAFSEEDQPSDDFLATTCRLWEEAADRFSAVAERVIKIRCGVVLDRRQGALPKMALPVKLGIGSPLGSGKQFVPWIHIDDIVAIYGKAVEDPTMTGVYNAVAPHPIKNASLLRELARVLHRPFFMPPLPAFLLKRLLGEMSGLLLEGSPVSAEKILKAGYQFRFENLTEALKDLCAS